MPGSSFSISRRRRRTLTLAAVLVLAVPGVSLAVSDPLADPVFDDVPHDNAHYANVQWLKWRGITQGCGDGTIFCPGDPVRRDQMASFLRRQAERFTAAAVRVEERPEGPVVTGGFNNVSSRAELPAVSASASGIVSVDFGFGFDVTTRTVQCTPGGVGTTPSPLALDRTCTVLVPPEGASEEDREVVQVANYDISAGQLVPGDLFLTVS